MPKTEDGIHIQQSKGVTVNVTISPDAMKALRGIVEHQQKAVFQKELRRQMELARRSL